MATKTTTATKSHNKKTEDELKAEAPKETPSKALLKFFNHGHLTVKLQGVAEPFAKLAQHVEDSAPDGPEKTTCLRKLLEAKDCAVRASV